MVFSANNEEQPVTQTASVMRLDENTSEDSVSGLAFYQYANMRSGGDQYGARWSSLDAVMNYYGRDFTYIAEDIIIIIILSQMVVECTSA